MTNRKANKIRLKVTAGWEDLKSFYSTLESFAFWRVYLGYRLNYNFSSKYKPFFGRKTSLKKYVNQFSHFLSLSLGFNTWNVRFETGLSPIIKLSSASKNFDSNFFISSVGLIFYLL